jgi:hypothetical protein
MTRNTSYAYFILLFAGMLCFANCKTDKDQIEDHKTAPLKNTVVEVKTADEQPNFTKDIAESSDTTVKEVKKPVQNEITTKSTKSKTIQVANKNKPKIEFEELVWNFGEITEGDIIEKKFKFTNTGNAPLEIKATSATCGCTRPSFPFLDIAPGESNEIGVTYNSVGKEGEQHPEVTVETNTDSKITTIKLYGTVIPKSEKKE